VRLRACLCARACVFECLSVRMLCTLTCVAVHARERVYVCVCVCVCVWLCACLLSAKRGGSSQNGLEMLLSSSVTFHQLHNSSNLCHGWRRGADGPVTFTYDSRVPDTSSSSSNSLAGGGNGGRDNGGAAGATGVSTAED
jgi:hypothetical protein